MRRDAILAELDKMKAQLEQSDRVNKAFEAATDIPEAAREPMKAMIGIMLGNPIVLTDAVSKLITQTLDKAEEPPVSGMRVTIPKIF